MLTRGLCWRLPARGLSARPGRAPGSSWAVGWRQRTKGVIHRGGILEPFSDIRDEHDNVSAFQIARMVLPANSTGDDVFDPHLVCFESGVLRIHIAYFPENQ